MTGTTHDGDGCEAQRTIEREWDESTPPSAVIVRAVAEEKGVDATDLRPLYEVVDTDALDALIRNEGVTMTVEYQGFRATVRGDGRVELVDCEDES